ncbi:cysteine synthase A [bacterium]|nr:cysteine synthase A [bacterium]
MNVADTILDLIGNTPMLRLKRINRGTVYAKAEFLNPGGSIKDRVARWIIEDAEQKGLLKPSSTIIEATSGNTGIGVALVGKLKGYRVIIVMPEDMSEERKKIVVALGAELILTPKETSITGAVEKAEELIARTPDSFKVGQFENPRNPEAHYKETAVEIWDQMEGRVDAFVAGVGSGGTLGGVGRYLKERLKNVHIVAVEPANSAALLGHEPGLHVIQGIGDGFVPPVLDVSLIDEVVTVTDDDAIETTRSLARIEGILAGTSSGANVWAAIRVGKKLGPGSRVVTVLPDRAERYFSTSLL